MEAAALQVRARRTLFSSHCPFMESNSQPLVWTPPPSPLLGLLQRHLSADRAAVACTKSRVFGMCVGWGTPAFRRETCVYHGSTRCPGSEGSPALRTARDVLRGDMFSTSPGRARFRWRVLTCKAVLTTSQARVDVQHAGGSVLQLEPLLDEVALPLRLEHQAHHRRGRGRGAPSTPRAKVHCYRVQMFTARAPPQRGRWTQRS